MRGTDEKGARRRRLKGKKFRYRDYVSGAGRVVGKKGSVKGARRMGQSRR